MFKGIPSSNNVPVVVKPEKAEKKDQGFALSPTTMATTAIATGLIFGAVFFNMFDEKDEKAKK